MGGAASVNAVCPVPTTTHDQKNIDTRESRSSSSSDADVDVTNDDDACALIVSRLPPPMTSSMPFATVGTSLVFSQQRQQEKQSTSSTAKLRAPRTLQSTNSSSTSTTSTLSSPPAPVTPRKLPKLSLSAYKRPEQTIRLTGDYWSYKKQNNYDAAATAAASASVDDQQTQQKDKVRQLENEYDLRAAGCKVIGHGAFSTVRSARSKTDGRMVAVKSISKFDALRARRLRRPPPPQQDQSLSSNDNDQQKQKHHLHYSHHHRGHLDEWEVLRLMQKNPYVLTLYDVFESDEEIHLVTELCQGGELFDAIQRKNKKGQRHSFRRPHFSEPQAARITYQVLKALVELHSKGIVHNDIKAENLLLLNDDESDIQVKLCDFGMARYHHHHHHHHDPQHSSSTTGSSSSGTSSDGDASPQTPSVLLSAGRDPTNVPPEGCNRNCGPAGDMYSLGVMLYILLCGFPPVFCNTTVEFPDAYWHSISADAKELVRMMLNHDPCSRITAADALKKAWVRQQTTRGRRGSISANLELVRSRLLSSLGTTGASASDTILSPQRRRSSLGGGEAAKRARDSINNSYSSNKRVQAGSLMLSPKRSQQSIELSMRELFTASESVATGAPTVAPCP